MLPNFICIGAQKSGTTSIWHIVNSHPDIYMAQPRETRFFHDDLQFAEGIHKYEIQYFSSWFGQTAVGEKCPEYLYVPSVARRIHETLGSEVKFIITLRSPAQRAFSHYRHNMVMLRECRSFGDALADEDRLIQDGISATTPYGYIARGFYARQLKNYLDFFKSDQLLIINFEKEIATDQKALSERLFTFLAVKSFYPEHLPFNSGHPRLEDLSIRIHTANANPQKHFVEITRERFDFRRFLKRMGGKDQSKKNSHHIYNPSAALIRFFKNFEQNRPVKPQLSRQQELEINHRYFLKEIRHLESLFPVNVKHWLE